MADNNDKTPQTAEEYFERGNTHRKKGDFDGAIADYDEAIRLNPDFTEALNNRGNAWGEKGEYDKAIADLNEAIRLKPDDVDAWNNRGAAWYEKGEYDKAIADCDEALRLKPDLQEAIHNRAVAIALKSSEAEHKEIAERLEKEYEEKLEQQLQSAVGQITADTKDFRQSYNDHKALSETLRGVAIALLVVIGIGLPIILWIIYCNEKDSLGTWGLMPWLPIVTAISAPFFLLWWMLQRWSFEALTLAYGFQRKAIVEERIFRFAGDDAKLRKELLKIYVVHWMEKSPLEVMLTIGGKKGMGGGDSPTAALLGKLAEKVGDGISKTGKDGAS